MDQHSQDINAGTFVNALSLVPPTAPEVDVIPGWRTRSPQCIQNANRLAVSERAVSWEYAYHQGPSSRHRYPGLLLSALAAQWESEHLSPLPVLRESAQAPVLRWCFQRPCLRTCFNQGASSSFFSSPVSCWRAGLAGGWWSERSEKEAENQGLNQLVRSEKVTFPSTRSGIVTWAMWGCCSRVSNLPRGITVRAVRWPGGLAPALSACFCEHFGFGILQTTEWPQHSSGTRRWWSEPF